VVRSTFTSPGASESWPGRPFAGPATSAAEIVRHFVSLFQHVVEASGGAAGCAVAGVTIDLPVDDEDLLGEARGAFHAWVALLADQLQTAGLARARAEGIAMIAVSSVEGALILCRAEGGSAPMDAVAGQLQMLVELSS